MGVLVRELVALYAAFSAGRPSPLPALPIQYADYAAWQRAWLSGEVLEAELAYWKEKLAGRPPPLELPTDRPRPPVQTYRGARWPSLCPALARRRSRRSSRRHGATLFMTLLAAFQALLQRYTGQDDIVVGSPIAGRTHAETEGLIGFFVNTLVLRTDLSASRRCASCSRACGRPRSGRTPIRRCPSRSWSKSSRRCAIPAARRSSR